MNSENKIRMHRPESATSPSWRLWSIRIVAILLLVLMCSRGSVAYSVLTHEEIVDLGWSDPLSPLLLKRFPALPGDQLKKAPGSAHGGPLIQDVAHYPLGN